MPPVDPYFNPNEILTRGLNGISANFRFSAVDILKQAIELGLPNEAQLKVLLQALRAEAIPRTMRQQMWQEMASAAHNSITSAYASRKFKRSAPSYRMGDGRFSGGALARALADPAMFVASPTGLAMFNTAILNKEAQHWRRLNFGAGERGNASAAPGQFPVTGLGLMVGMQSDVREAFTMPKGYWSGEGQIYGPDGSRTGKDQFLFYGSIAASPYRKSRPSPKVVPTRGISAANFLDAPIRLVGTLIKPGLDTLWETARKDAGRSQIIRKSTGRARLPRTLGW